MELKIEINPLKDEMVTFHHSKRVTDSILNYCATEEIVNEVDFIDLEKLFERLPFEDKYGVLEMRNRRLGITYYIEMSLDTFSIGLNIEPIERERRIRRR